METLTR